MLDPKVAGCKGKLFCMVGFIFVSGIITGGLAVHLAERYWLAPPQAAILNQAEKQMAVQHFSQELDLNAEQARALDDILDEFIMQQANLMEQFRSSRVSGHDRILGILNEDQRKRFKKVLDQMSHKQRD